MKYLQLLVTPAGLAIHPVDRFIASQDDVQRQSILHVDSRPGEMTILYQLSGDREAFESALDQHDAVSDYETVINDDGFGAYVQASPGEERSALIDIAHEHALIIDTPIGVEPDGLSVRLVGTHDGLRRALSNLPDEMDITVENAGPYVPEGPDLLSPLTERQLEVFRTAVDQGYYDVPRRATHKDIAGKLDCAPSTVDEHLRKAEARVVSGLIE